MNNSKIMEEHFYGLNDQIIPQEIVIHDCILEDKDIIENQDDIQLIYLTAQKGFIILNNNPYVSSYLSNNQLYSKWKKI